MRKVACRNRTCCALKLPPLKSEIWVCLALAAHVLLTLDFGPKNVVHSFWRQTPSGQSEWDVPNEHVGGAALARDMESISDTAPAQ